MNRPDPITRLRDELDALDRAYSSGHHGLWSARRRAELLDGALIELFEASDPPPGVVLAALGGYGRLRQLPRSDVDLLILHDGSHAEETAALTERLLYPLWDAGFEVGHAVRTAEECVVIAGERLDALTAMLDLRHLAGDRAAAEGVLERVRDVARSDAGAFGDRLRDAGRERAERYGSASHLLEPDLKEGTGGLRDVATAGWLEAALGSTLEERGILRPSERESLDAAEEFLTRVRSTLHLRTGRRTDRLVLEHQTSVALAMGFQDHARLIAEDGLMRSVFEHARQVERIVGDMFERLLGGPVGEGVDPSSLSHDPAAVLASLAAAVEEGRTPTPSLLDAIEAADVPDPVEWTDGVRDAFLRIVRAGEAGVDALDTLDLLGLLARYLPAWADVRCRPQRDPYHRFTVDTHLTGALRNAGRLLVEPDAADPFETEAVKLVDDRDGFLLGALLHDIGKIGEGGHVAIGTRVAADTLDRMRVPAATRDLAAYMVEQHLLLPDTATRRDLTDEDLIMDVAAKIGSPGRLAALSLLAKADAAATGPAAWTPWRQALIRELVGKVRRVFDRGEMGAELAERLSDRIGRLRDLLEAEPEVAVERFILRMPRGYFLSVEPARAARHFRTIAPPLGRNEVRTAAAAGSRPATYELLVVAADRPGLLSWIAGALTMAGLSILTAQVFTTTDGEAADLFEVEGAFEPEVGERRWREFRGTLRDAVEGRVSLAHRVAEKRGRYPPPRSDAPVTVAVDNRASDFSTVIEVGGPDRIGLLYDVTSVLADLKLDVHLAKVATYDGRVIDAFYVRDALGGKVTDPAQVSEVETAMRARLQG